MSPPTVVRRVKPGHASGAAPTRMSPAQLAEIVRETAAAEQSWRPIVQFTDGPRWFRRLALAAEYEVWLLSWLPGQHTGFHDHGDASGAFTVAQGELRESLAAPGRSDVLHRTAAAASVTSFGARHLHDVSNISAEPAISLHAYSPPLTAMRRYEMTASGLVLAGTERAETSW